MKICMSLTHLHGFWHSSISLCLKGKWRTSSLRRSEMSPSLSQASSFSLHCWCSCLQQCVQPHFLDLGVLSLLPRQRTAILKVWSFSERWCTAGVITGFLNGIFKDVLVHCSWVCMYLKNQSLEEYLGALSIPCKIFARSAATVFSPESSTLISVTILQITELGESICIGS